MKTAFDVSIGSFWVVFSEKKIRYSLSFSHTEQTFFGIQSIIFQQGCQKKLSKFLFISGRSEKKFLPFDEKNAVGLPKLLSTCSQEQFERSIFFKKKSWFSFISSDMSKKSLAFCQISFEWIVKSVFYEPKWSIRRKIFSKKIENIWNFNSFSDFDREKSRLSGKISSAELKKLHFTSL